MKEVHDDRAGCDWVHHDSDTRIERGRFNRHRIGIAGRFLRIPGLLPVWLLSVRRRLIIRLLSITAVCTGLTIGGTAVGFLFGTATSAKVVSRGVGPIPSSLWYPNAFLGQRSHHARNTGLETCAAHRLSRLCSVAVFWRYSR